ncbi:unnamed protein product [Microthlaspi erraticum]|uniref:Reverse transcriptase Ty1/copia-type domain-containing protein n=1 Tax=Microthlaspi erraticum TaxID=1685480 RepID=A0A6D2ILG6_9BRAS|nr:unnamed protein product [Microthlaspi erraticum]CAA7050817.1 unnamed protein product [Microthlaspi erraticum]
MIINNSESSVHDFIDALSSCFKLRDLGEAKYFLGLEIARSFQGISVCQRKYVLELLEVTGFLGCKPSSVPLDPGVKLTKDAGTPLTDPTSYRKIVGKLMYLHTTRPDISYSVNTLCQFSHDPRDVHLKAAHKVLRYLKGSVGQGLFYAADSSFDLHGYTDSDWGTSTDDRKSISGYCMFIGDSLVSWKSKK